MTSVYFIGESMVGKTSLVSKLADRTYNPPEETETYDFWSRQEAPAKTQLQGMDLFEVPGSRGRSSNYHQLVEGVKKADVIVLCYTVGNSYGASGLKHQFETVKRALSATSSRRFSKRRSVFGKKKQEGDEVEEPQETPKPVPPILVLGLKSDLKKSLDQMETQAREEEKKRLEHNLERLQKMTVERDEKRITAAEEALKQAVSDLASQEVIEKAEKDLKNAQTSLQSTFQRIKTAENALAEYEADRKKGKQLIPLHPSDIAADFANSIDAQYLEVSAKGEGANLDECVKALQRLLSSKQPKSQEKSEEVAETKQTNEVSTKPDIYATLKSRVLALFEPNKKTRVEEKPSENVGEIAEEQAPLAA